MGKPVVATNIPGNTELVVHEETGLLVPAADPEALAQAITHLLADEELRRRFGENGRQRIREWFSVQCMTRQFEQLYQEFVPCP